MLGGVVPLEALDEPARLGGGEGFVERGGLVGVEIVLKRENVLKNLPEATGITTRNRFRDLLSPDELFSFWNNALRRPAAFF